MSEAEKKPAPSEEGGAAKPAQAAPAQPAPKAATQAKPAPKPAAAQPAQNAAQSGAAVPAPKAAAAKKPAQAAPAATAKPTPAAPAPKPMARAEQAPVRESDAAPRRRRAWGGLLSFLLLVAAPLGGLGYYLWTHAADQYASEVGFSVRSTETQTAFEFLGSLTSLGGTSSYDSQVLFDYLQSQIIVAKVDAALDVQAMWSKPAQDRLFAWTIRENITIEELTQYWQRMVSAEYDSNSGLIRLQVKAFDPQDAQNIAQEILSESALLVNQLAATAQEDGIRFAAQELARAEERLKEARTAISTFRNTHQIVDPSLDLQAQMEIFGVLERQKTDALIELDLLRGTTRDNDPRIAQAERRLAVIEERLAEERGRIGGGVTAIGDDSTAMSEVLGQYEALSVEREFAQGAYVAALASYDRTRAEAGRQSLYLATHIPPTLPQAPEYPKREQILAITAALLLAGWLLLRIMSAALRQRQ